jgi:hemerythrin
MSTWNPSLIVENAALDSQHITLHEIGRSILSTIQSGDGSSERIVDLLHDFVSLSKSHDATEEAILACNGCPSLQDHMAIHRASRDQFSAFLSDAKIANVDSQALSHAVAQ